MAQIIKEIRVDVSQPNVFQAIVAKQNDCNSRFLKVTLTDCGVKINIESTAKVTINANRPDGESQSFIGEANNDGTVTVPLAQWMLLVVGLLKCDVSVIDTTDGERLTTTTFYVDVQEAANSNTDYSENPEGEFRVITPVTVVDENSTDDKYPSAKAVYSYGQDILADTKVTASASGKEITIESANAPLQALKLYGSTTQDGTPTPTEPKELKSVGDSGSFNVNVCGQIFVDFKNAKPRTNSGISFSYKGNKIHYENTTGISSAVDTGSITLPAGTYTAYAKNLSGSGYMTIGVAGLYMSSSAPRQVLVITKPTVVRFMITTSNMTSVGSYDCYCGIVVGDVPLEQCPTIDEDLPDIQTLTMPYTLRSVGEVKDEVDFNRGVLVQRILHKNLKDYPLKKGNALTDGSGVSWYVIDSTIAPYQSVEAYSTHFKQTFDRSWEDLHLGEMVVGSQYIVLGVSQTTVEEFSQWLIENNPKFISILETPIETPLTETELNAYRQLMTNSGNTTILSEADMTLDYYTPKGQALGRIHEQVNKDYLKLQQAITQL